LFLHSFDFHYSRIPYIPTLSRHLKSMYFTVLERFSREELLGQAAALSGLEAELLSDTKAKSRRRTLRNQKDRIHARLKELELETPDGNVGSDLAKGEDDVDCVVNCEVTDREGFNVTHLPSPSPSSSSVHTTQNAHSNSTSSSLHRHELVRDNITSMTASLQPSLHSSPLDTSPIRQLGPLACEEIKKIKGEENTVNTRHERTLDPLIPHRENLDPHFPDLVSVPSDSSIPLNPKTRLGWGFWQT
jgi:hypothetical protein